MFSSLWLINATQITALFFVTFRSLSFVVQIKKSENKRENKTSMLRHFIVDNSHKICWRWEYIFHWEWLPVYVSLLLKHSLQNTFNILIFRHLHFNFCLYFVLLPVFLCSQKRKRWNRKRFELYSHLIFFVVIALIAILLEKKICLFS